MPALVIAYLVAAYVFSWWPMDDTERAVASSDYNAYFYYPNNREKYLGQVDGLNSCQAEASAYAWNKNIQNSNWSYICCRIADGSSCASKHR